MKFDWNKLWNPNNIDFKKLNEMSKADADVYLKEIIKGDVDRILVRFVYMTHFICFTNIWQYAWVLWGVM
jgi:hypothetical protein